MFGIENLQKQINDLSDISSTLTKTLNNAISPIPGIIQRIDTTVAQVEALTIRVDAVESRLQKLETKRKTTSVKE